VVHGALLEYEDADQIDTKEIAERYQITPQHVGAHHGNLRSGPNIYKELLKAGYDEPVIPGWGHRPGRVDLVGASRTSLDQAESPGITPLGRGLQRPNLAVLWSNQVHLSPGCCPIVSFLD
jgi:hypothetical protein